MPRVLSLALWLGSLAVLAVLTTAITRYFAPNTPAQRTAAWHRSVDPLILPSRSDSDAAAPAEKRLPDVQITTSHVAQPTPKTAPEQDALRMDDALGLVGPGKGRSATN
ncbi:MAG: hypothetical protein PF501_08595 [Salinisphaera sp.]|jgi:hypothetical protein|nr:hypothetical protein [Salinisphaera sp.]